MGWETMKHEVKKISLLFYATAVVTIIVHVIAHCSFGIMGGRLTLRVRERMFAAILRNEICWFDDVNNTSAMLSS
ncbi:ABC transporter B family member 10-like [Rhodamnia argentea]|uniref:ABC transporter B family member 10-like n=1 Tax=Rhodamnia argentea TaxID=178133 RepID=A0ABM3HK69_9MYRT|nr:ABC transporter B family member 10-like [Rhodamnia argentea]